MNAPTIVFQGVSRRFGRRVALDRVSFGIEAGSVVGLVGRNAAGKTTSLRLMQGLLFPDAGHVRVLGLDPVREGLAVRERVALLGEESSLYDWMRVSELLDFASRLHPRWSADLAAQLTSRLELERGAKVKELSRGSRAKLALVCTVATRPEVLLLDDPTAGLDPLVRREILATIVESVPDAGGAVVYASHLVQDIERLADRVLVLDRGVLRLDAALPQLAAETRSISAVFSDGAPAALRPTGTLHAQHDGRLATFLVRGDVERATQDVITAGGTIAEVTGVPLEEFLIATLREPALEVQHD